MNDIITFKMSTWPKCSDKCIFYHHMVDVNDGDYRIAFCGYDDEVIYRRTLCVNYMEEVKDDGENA